MNVLFNESVFQFRVRSVSISVFGEFAGNIQDFIHIVYSNVSKDMGNLVIKYLACRDLACKSSDSIL